VSQLPDIPDESALARLFHQERVQEEAVWFSLPGGQTLFAAGDRSEQLYFVRAGRLGAFRREQGHEIQFLGVIRPGEPAGEMSLIADAPHSADVVALRDSEIIAVPREVFFEACEADTAVMIELAKLMMLRSRQAVTRGGVGEPSVFGFVSLGNSGALRPLVERLAREIVKLGYDVTTIGAEAQSAPTEWFSEVERVHDMRVATRRLRAALEIFEPCFPRKRHRKALKRVKALADALGERRDADVETSMLEGLLEDAAEADRGALRALIDELGKRQVEANEALAPYVTPKRLKKLRRRLKKLVKKAGK